MISFSPTHLLGVYYIQGSNSLSSDHGNLATAYWEIITLIPPHPFLHSFFISTWIFRLKLLLGQGLDEPKSYLKNPINDFPTYQKLCLLSLIKHNTHKRKLAFKIQKSQNNEVQYTTKPLLRFRQFFCKLPTVLFSIQIKKMKSF